MGNSLREPAFEHLREYDNDGKERENMKDHDAAFDEWELAKEDRVDQENERQDRERD